MGVFVVCANRSPVLPGVRRGVHHRDLPDVCDQRGGTAPAKQDDGTEFGNQEVSAPGEEIEARSRGDVWAQGVNRIRYSEANLRR